MAEDGSHNTTSPKMTYTPQCQAQRLLLLLLCDRSSGSVAYNVVSGGRLSLFLGTRNAGGGSLDGCLSGVKQRAVRQRQTSLVCAFVHGYHGED
jgi:hypothetical protein